MYGRYCHVETGRTGEDQVWVGKSEIRTSALGHAKVERPLRIRAVISSSWLCIRVWSPVEKPGQGFQTWDQRRWVPVGPGPAHSVWGRTEMEAPAREGEKEQEAEGEPQV